MDYQTPLAAGIFILAYAFIISEKIHRTIIALLGAALMIWSGILTQESAISHIDWNTLWLLIGMMIIVNITRETGLFKFLAIWAAKKCAPILLRCSLLYLVLLWFVPVC